MSAPPGGSFLPFMTSVTTDIYERIDKLSQSMATVTDTLKVIIVDIKDNFENIAKNVGEMLEQGEMNRDMTLEAFSDSMNTLIHQIKTIRNETLQGLQSPQTKAMMNTVSDTANLIEARMYDIQIAFLINGIHALINAIKSGKVYGIPVAVRGLAAPVPQAQTPSQELGAPIPAISAAQPTDKKKRKPMFGKGAHKKTHDEIMEEKRKKDAIFRKYLK